MYRRFIGSLVVAGLSLLLWSPAAEAKIVTVKMNWDVGTYTMSNSGTTQSLAYKDAHIELATTGWFEDGTVSTANNGFGSASSSITHGHPDDTMTIDWAVNPGAQLNGRHHIGAEFKMDTLGFTDAAVRVKNSTLTDVVLPSTGGTSTPELSVPGPAGFKYKPGSVNWEFRADDVFITGPITFTNVAFYKTNTEPALSDLDAVNFPPLPKAFLQLEPDFLLNAGQTHLVSVPGAIPADWLLITYTSSWVDPWLSQQVGEPAVVDVNTWVAAQMIPIPSAGVAGIALCVFAGLSRRRIVA
ncbi:MAG: hypothetical protein CMJ49_06790 [Planctomycetaceae bacterium]|nr:hypothetical protein [Planctomycetaceae bacterium]